VAIGTPGNVTLMEVNMKNDAGTNTESGPAAGLRGGLIRLWTGRLTIGDLWLILPPVMAFVFLVNRQIHPADFWWHVRTGQIIATTGQIPTTDLFTFTRAGETWINQAWLMQLLLYLELQVGGLPFVLFAHALVITAGYLLVELACLRVANLAPPTPQSWGERGAKWGAQRAAALATIAAMAIGIVHWHVRPQSASFLGFGAVVYILSRSKRPFVLGRTAVRPYWALPFVFALWVNLHGGFVFGLGLVVIYAAMHIAMRQGRRRASLRDHAPLLAAVALSGAALALNPGGPVQAVRYVFSFLASSTTIQKNLEFQPLSIREADGLIFFVVLLITLVLLWRRPQAAAADQIAILVVFGLASLYARRIVPWYGMALAPTLALALAQLDARDQVRGIRDPTTPPPVPPNFGGPGGREEIPNPPAPFPTREGGEELPSPLRGGAGGEVLPSPHRGGAGGEVEEAPRRATIMNYVVLAVMAFFTIAMLPWVRPYVPPPFSRSYVVEDFNPEEAARRLCALGPTARPFTNIFFASYLEWACPAVPTFIDTRFELYPAAMWQDYIRITNGLYDWEERLARYGINVLFVQKESEFELIAAAKASGRWETLYEDAYAILMRRVAP